MVKYKVGDEVGCKCGCGLYGIIVEILFEKYQIMITNSGKLSSYSSYQKGELSSFDKVKTFKLTKLHKALL